MRRGGRGLILLLVFISTVQTVLGATAAEWRNRTIYQLLTDRFARTDGSTLNCANYGDYCGGSWQGITDHLDYVQSMGFDAIWISPVVDNTEGGYHGFWARNFEKLNDHFGTEKELERLVAEAHRRDMFVMFGVVANHVGPVGTDYRSIAPFNDSAHYHDCGSPCPSDNSCNIEDWSNQPQVEHCRLSGLPDLNQEVCSCCTCV
jgi:alpha-amylase